MESIFDDILLHLIQFLNISDYYSLKSINKHFYEIIPLEKRKCLLKKWQTVSQKVSKYSEWEKERVLIIKDFYQGGYFVHDWGLLFKCCYQDQINSVSNFYNLHIFVFTFENKCYRSYWVPVESNVRKSQFQFHYKDNHLIIHNAQKQFDFVMKDDAIETLCANSNYGGYDNEPEVADYKELKVWVSKNLITIYQRNNMFYQFTKTIHTTNNYITLTQIDRLVILKIPNSSKCDVFDFTTLKISLIDFDFNDEICDVSLFCNRSLFENCESYRFVYLQKSGLLAFFSFNKCTLFQHDDSKWVVYRQFLHRSSATLFGFCEEEQRMIKFF